MNFASFLAGIAFITFWLSALLFLKFWRASGDIFFKRLSLAFFMIGAERLVGIASFVTNQSDLQEAHRPWIYLIRLVAFIIILIAVIQKNRSTDLR